MKMSNLTYKRNKNYINTAFFYQTGKRSQVGQHMLTKQRRNRHCHILVATMQNGMALKRNLSLFSKTIYAFTLDTAFPLQGFLSP